MTFRGSFERDVKEFAENDADMKAAVADEDDDAVETIMNERFYHRPEMYYSPDKLDPLLWRAGADPGIRLQRRRQEAAADQGRDRRGHGRFHRRAVQSPLQRAEMARCHGAAGRRRSRGARRSSSTGDMTVFTASQFNQLGGVRGARRSSTQRDEVFEALRQSIARPPIACSPS